MMKAYCVLCFSVDVHFSIQLLSLGPKKSFKSPCHHFKARFDGEGRRFCHMASFISINIQLSRNDTIQRRIVTSERYM